MTPIVLIPGLGGSLRPFLPILPALWRHGSVTVVNQTADDTIAGMARRLLAEAPPRFALIGHSMGGYVALEVMRQAPERVERLALMNTSARLDTPVTTALRRQRIADAEAGRYLEMTMENFPRLVHGSRVDDAALKEEARRTAEEAGAAAFVRQTRAIMGRVDSRPFLKGITVPTLVLTSDDDNVLSNEFSREMAEFIPNCTFVTIETSGHLTPSEQPDAVIAALEAWLVV